jgi:hypothetical protein
LRPIELGFGLLLILTIAGKVFAVGPDAKGDQQLFAATTAKMLAGQGFATRLERRPGGIVIHAQRGDCRITLRDYPIAGTYAATIAEQARAIGTLSFAYRGALLATPPKAEPITADYLRRIKQRLRLASVREPVVAIAAGRPCEVRAMPWNRLASLPR